jgi:hypothetical protein
MVFISDFGLNIKFGKRFSLVSFEIEAILRDEAVEYDDVLFSNMKKADDDLYEYRTGDLGQFYKTKKKLKLFKQDMQNLEYGFYFPLDIPFEFFK